MAKKYFWFKMKDDFLKTKEMKKLRKIAGGDTYTLIYLKLIMLSIKTDGKLFYDGVEDSFVDELALEIDEETDNVKVTMAYLIKNGLLDQMSETELVVNEAVKNIGSETESAERVRIHRERKHTLALQCNGDVTKCNTEIELEKELEIELDLKKEKEKNSTSNSSNFVKAYMVSFKDYFGMMPRVINDDCFDVSAIDGMDMIEMFTDFYRYWENRCPFDRDRQTIKSECSIENIYAQINRYALNGEW